MTTPFEGWAIVEVMGHRRHFGMVSEVDLFGVKMCRIDVPETPAIERNVIDWDRDSNAPCHIEKVPPLPPRTHLYGGAAIFSLTPCTEEVVREALLQEQRQRVIPRASMALGSAPVESPDGDEVPY